MPVIDRSELPQNLQEIEAPPIRPGAPPLGGPPAKNDIPNYFSGSIAPQLQHDGIFVGMKYGAPGVPSYPIMPVAAAGQAGVNSAVTSVIKNTTTIVTTPESQLSEMNWRGTWSPSLPYAVDDVVQQNISTYIALSANTNVKPDQNPGTWTLVSKNLNFRGQFGSGGPNYPTLPYWTGNTTSSLTTAFAYAVNPSLAVWQTAHSYSLGVKIIDSNGNQQTVITAGTSQGGGHPTWNTNVGGQTIDNAGPSQVVWVNGGPANSITVGDVLIFGVMNGPIAGSATASLTDSSGNTWTQTGPTESFTDGDNGRTYTIQLFTTVATATIASGGSYTVTVHTTAAADTNLTIAGFGPTMGSFTTGTGATSGGQGPLAPGAITIDAQSFMVFLSGTTRTSGFSGGTPPWNFVSSGSGALEKDMAWAVLEPGVSNPTTSSTGSGGLACIQAQFNNQGTNLNYVPFDTVLFQGSTYVCVAETSSSPRVAPASWVLLSQGTGAITNLTGNYSAVALDDGRLLTNTSSSSYTLTLPSPPPTPWWWIAVQNSGAGTIVISPNGLQLDSSGSNLTLVQNQGVLIFTDGTNYFTERGFGTVFSVGLSLPNIFTVTVSPITGSGTLTAVLANQSANLVFAGPASGGPATPTFRSLSFSDITGIIAPGQLVSGTANRTAQTANVAATTLFAVGASGAGLYLVTVDIVISTAATVSSTLPDSRITWTDQDSGATITAAVTPGLGTNTTSTFAQATFVANAKASTNIQYDIGQVTPYATSGATSMQFAYRARAVYLG